VRHSKISRTMANMGLGCVKTRRGITTPGILSPVVMRRAKKHKSSSSARHYDQIRFRFHTSWVINCRAGHGPSAAARHLITDTNAGGRRGRDGPKTDAKATDRRGRERRKATCAMSACAPTPDVSLRRTNRCNGSKLGKPQGKPKITVRPEINARRGDRPIIRWVSGSGAAERRRSRFSIMRPRLR
jgi:hypothetical protein